MTKLEEYEVLRGYRLPQGWTPETMRIHQDAQGIDTEYVPLASGGGAVAWGIPYLLQFDRPGIWRSLDGRFETLDIGRGQIEVYDNKAPSERRHHFTDDQCSTVRSINEAEAWCRERAAFCWL